MCSGFTLAEILVVIALTGILGALVYPDLTGFLGTQKVETAAGEVALAILYAQSASIKGSMHMAAFKMDPGYVQVEDCKTDADTDGDRCGDSDDVIADEPLSRGVRRYKIDFEEETRFAGVSIVSSDFEDMGSKKTKVAFDELGIPTSSGSVILKFGDQCREISVSSVGGLVETSSVACPAEVEMIEG